jgi:rhamnogalacturonyl hydrolase YesR
MTTTWSQKRDNRSPLSVATTIGDKLIKETPFKYRLIVPAISTIFNDVQAIDFGQKFTTNVPAVAYAFTTFTSKQDIRFPIQLAHNDGCKIWVNHELVYNKESNNSIQVKFDERSLVMNEECVLPLKKGVNNILIKTESAGHGKWQIFLQPPSAKGAIVSSMIDYPIIGLKAASNIDSSVYKIANWLVIGPFENKVVDKKRTGLSHINLPEQEIEFGKMYQGAKGLITWVLPDVKLVGDVINPKPWGTSYNWNYHNGGVAWAMEQLSEVTKEKKYMQYADDFCNFHLNGKPFIEYQVNELQQFNSANSNFINTPLLDFTLAPSLPLIYKIRKDSTSFTNKSKYKQFVDSMMQYALYSQLRLPSSNIFTRSTPQKYTTWVDDMFMGIPFLVQASLYSKDISQRNQFLQDAANQIIGFNHEVFDESVGLYSHAHTVGATNKLPHWSRANGWGIWATTEVLMNLPKTDKRYQEILKSYQKHTAALKSLQDSSGLWLNVLDVKTAPIEVSGSAIFAMAIARGIRLGWLNKQEYMPVVMKAWEGIKSCIEQDGTVHNICMGTMCSEDVNYYLNRPFYDNDTHGLFAVLFACIEIDKLNNVK